MQRLYVVPRKLLFGSLQVGYDYTTAAPVMVETVRLFHPKKGGHGIDLPGDMLLFCSDFGHDEGYEDLWHNHPDVAILPHPTTDGHKKLATHIGSEPHRYKQHHHDAILAHETLGSDHSDTVLTLATKAQKIHPLVAFRNLL